MNSNIDTSDFVISDFKDFCYILHIKIYEATQRSAELNDQFTLYINVLDRGSDHEKGRQNFIYAGLKKQRQLFEGYDKIKREKSLDNHWLALENVKIRTDSAALSKSLIAEYEREDFELEDIKFLELFLYFSNELNDRQIHEKAILEHHLEDFTNYRILSLPLIKFGDFEGVVHIVFNRNEESILKARKNLLIKVYSDEIENLLFDWDLVGENIYKESLIDILDKLEDENYYKEKNKNPILKELKYLEHYQASKDYYIIRRKQNNAVYDKFMYQYRKSAVTAILIDSFAHNMSAHSLTALNWWFQKRSKILLQKDKVQIDDKSVPESFKKDIPLADAIHPLLKFLLEKGAFWTGLNRERNFGGSAINLFDVLWDNFIRNPLFLGSIAYSEKIVKLNINFTIIEKSNIKEDGFGFARNKKIKRNDANVLLNGTLAEIDLENTYIENKELSENERYSHFIKKGDKFEALKAELLKYNIYFPSGITGYHAFFTILENEIRNVKHFSEDQLEEMKVKGLTLNISVEENYFSKLGKKPVLYKLGIWLKHESCITEKLITGRLKKLEEDIITDSFKPKLGGTYQDKVCAAMLFNNLFMSVQWRTRERDKVFYPWVKSGYSDIFDDNIDSFDDIEISWRRYKEKSENEKYLKSNIKEKKGYFKKFINLWKGELVKKNNIENSEEQDNISRFKFVEIPENNDKLFAKVRKKDIIRIIHNVEDKRAEKIYPLWLNKWFDNKFQRINFIINKQTIGQVVFDEEGVRYYNKADRKNRKILDKTDFTRFQQYEQTDFYLKHGNIDEDSKIPDDKICNYRSHGTFRREFCNDIELSEASLKPEKAAELMEFLLTRICIFDNRIANRVDKVNKTFYRQSLGSAIYEEKVDLWNEVKERKFENIHFLVIHLSFIEAFEVKGQKIYSEKGIPEFLETEVFQGDREGDLWKRAGTNFMIVITSGRGRSDWWNSVKDNEDYNKFVTFRQVESLITATELAMSINDDIEIKYQLAKVLFGS